MCDLKCIITIYIDDVTAVRTKKVQKLLRQTVYIMGLFFVTELVYTFCT